MARRNLIVLNNPSQWAFDVEDAEVVPAKDYLTASRYAVMKHARVFNLCRSYRYQSIGYYVSLLAAARDHHAIPNIITMQDFKSQTIVRTIAEDVDELIQKTLGKHTVNETTLFVYFGQTTQAEGRPLGRALYHLFQAPLLKIDFVKTHKWLIQQITPLSLDLIPDEDRKNVPAMAKTYFMRKRFPRSRIQQYAYDLAMLVDPAESSPPSSEKALRKFEEAADRLNVFIERITRKEYSRLTEFDALFIRVTTAVNHYTYRFARKAFAEGLVVIDDPFSIVRCANKVYLAERLMQAGVRTPRTVILQRDHLKTTEVDSLGLTFPCVLKKPDSAFSVGVTKVLNKEELRTQVHALFEKSDLLIAQQYLPSPYDWRIGVLDRKALYACRYYMARDHWQIYNWSEKQPQAQAGESETLPLDQVPKNVLHTAVKAANLMGDGFYGVDLKVVEGKVYVIEVNDNPSVDAGVEDLVLQRDLYTAIIRSIIRRIDVPFSDVVAG